MGVEPWERDVLAKEEMQLVTDPVEAGIDDHIYFSKEASSDGRAFGDGGIAKKLIRLATGALATSGDARRFVLRDGRRYGHILDPLTGWPVVGAPRSITVAADTCTQAGMLATLAMLKGADAESFLEDQAVRFWSLR